MVEPSNGQLKLRHLTSFPQIMKCWNQLNFLVEDVEAGVDFQRLVYATLDFQPAVTEIELDCPPSFRAQGALSLLEELSTISRPGLSNWPQTILESFLRNTKSKSMPCRLSDLDHPNSLSSS
ncbi:hypothetical protein BT69DRAFT_815290 [Atractiella rhizophila]|nr:hypothetical protein BT69DRAFT_815290 [Atractiella rhizophila]